MACKYIFNNNIYSSKEEFINQVIKPQFLSNQKIRRVMELQSDLFQKGRDRKNLLDRDETDYLTTARKQISFEEFKRQITNLKLTPEYGAGGVSYENDDFYFYTEDYNLENDGSTYNVAYKSATKIVDESKNQFLQLLNKDNNWVTFFVKSIIQDSAKKGYEKVLFPKGDTASKIEGHDTLEEFKKQKEDRIKELEKQLENLENNNIQGAYDFSATSNSGKWNSANNELLSLVHDNRKAFAIYKFLIGDVQSFKEIIDFLNEKGIEIPYTERMKRADETMSADEIQSAIDSYNNSVNEKVENKNQVEKNILSENNLQDETEYTPQELIEKYPLSGVQKVIWNLIKDIVNKLGIKVKFSSSRITEGFDGSNNPQNGEILIRPSTLKNGRFTEVLVHEVVHALTTKIISRVNSGVTTGLTQKQINAVKGLMKLFESVKADNNLENKYPVKDVFEFIAHLTNDAFVKELESKDRNFLQKVVDFILDILGINNANDLAKKYLVDIISDGTFLEENGITVLPSDYGNNLQGSKSEEIQKIKSEINQLKQELERIETEGFAALRPIYKFYEETVGNILKKQGYNPVVITDEYGNQWNEVVINRSRDLDQILLQRPSITNSTNIDSDLYSSLVDFALALNPDFQINILSDLLENRGANGIARIKDFVIDLQLGKESALPEEIAHFFVELLPDNHSLKQAMYDQIPHTKLYKQVVKEYREVYGNDTKRLQREAMAKMISLYLTDKDLFNYWSGSPSFIEGLIKWIKTFFQWLKGKSNPFIESAYKIKNKDVLDLRIEQASQAMEMYSLSEFMNKTQVLESLNGVNLKPYDKIFINISDTILDYQNYQGSAKEKRDFLFDERKKEERDKFYRTAKFTSLAKELEDKVQFINPEKIVFYTQFPVNEVLIERLAHLGMHIERINVQNILTDEEGNVIKEFESNSLKDVIEKYEGKNPLVIDNSSKSLDIPHTFRRFNSRKSSYVSLKTRLERDEQQKNKVEKEHSFLNEMKLIEQSEVILKVKEAFEILNKELQKTKQTEFILEKMGDQSSIFRDKYGNLTIPLSVAKNASLLIEESKNYEKGLIQYLLTLEATTKFFKDLNASKFTSTKNLIENGSEEDIEKAIQELYTIGKLGTDWQTYIKSIRDIIKELSHTNTIDSVLAELDGQITRTKAIALDLSNQVISKKLASQFEAYNLNLNSQIKELDSKIESAEGIEKERLLQQKEKLTSLLKTPTDIFNILTGTTTDIDNLTVWIKTLHNSGDPLIGSIGKLMQKAFAEVEIETLQRSQDFGSQVADLQNEYNITQKDIEDDLITFGKVRVFNHETKEYEIKDRLELLNPFQNTHEYEVRKEEIDKLRLAYKQNETDESKREYFVKKKEFEDWLNQNWHQQYTTSFYERYASLQSTPEEQELFEEVKQDQINIFEQINDLVMDMDSMNESVKKESLKKIQLLRQELKNLKRSVYFDGTPKTGRDLQKAEMLQKKSEIDKDVYEYKPNFQKFRTEFAILLNTLELEEDVKQNLLLLSTDDNFSKLYAYASENAPFEVKEWLDENTIIKYSDSWYTNRSSIAEGISKLTSEINELSGVTAGANLAEDWKELMNLSSALRDEDGILDGSISTPPIQLKVLEYEKKIETTKRLAREESKGTYSSELKEKKRQLSELISKLKEIQNKSLTDAYNEEFITLAQESGFLNAFNNKYPSLQFGENSNLLLVINSDQFSSFVNERDDVFTEWFKRNHYVKSSITEGQETFSWSPTYIWYKIEPTNDNDILTVPSYQYSIRSVKDVYKTEKQDWVTWNPINKKWLPKSDKYFNSNYIKLMQDRSEKGKGLVKILKLITDYHLATQSKSHTPHEAKIGFGLPYVDKRNLETTEYVKNIYRNLINKNNRFEEGEANFDETTDKPKSIKEQIISWFNGNTETAKEENSTERVRNYTKIAVPYSSYVEPEFVSKDVLLSSIMFAGSTAKAERMLKESKLFTLIENSLQSTQIQTDRKGNLKSNNANRYKAFRFYLDHHVYGMNKQYELGKYGKQIDRTLTTVRKLNTFGTLGFPFGFANTIKNNLQGRLQNIIGNRFADWSSNSSMRKASLNLNTNFFKFLSEIEKPSNKRSLDYHILTFFNPHHLKQGELILKGGAKRVFQDKTVYLINEGMEFSISANLLYAHLYHKKVKNDKGEIKTLYEIFKIENNKLTVEKDYVDYRTGKPIDLDYLMNLKLGYKTIMEYTQGKVDSKTLLNTYTIGQTLLYFKNWLIPMLRRRFDKSRPNYIVGEEIEGYWRTFGRLSYRMLMDFVQHGKLYWNTFSDEEKRNYMTTLNEIAFVILSSIFIALVFGFDANDPDKYKKLKDNSYAENLALLIALQAKSETETLSMMPFFNIESQVVPPIITESLRLVKNPTTGFSAAEDLLKIVDSTYGLILDKPTAYYDKNMPQFNIEKGDTKLEHYVTKFIQLDNWIYATENPEGRIQSFISMIKR